MDSAILRPLSDKLYDKRKIAALELEKVIRECFANGEEKRLGQIIDQLAEMLANHSNPTHVRNGGQMGLAAAAIALGVDISPYMPRFIKPCLLGFTDPEERIRYFSAECMYNVGKVAKGEMLVFFNDIFDSLCKLSADPVSSVKNGADLLDRLMKDLVADHASVYVPLFPETAQKREELSKADGVLITLPDYDENGPKKAFSLPHFIPLLRDRIQVVSSFARSYLVSWIIVLDSVPELELITFLPEFLDGLLKYLSDPTEDVKVATQCILADFLHELQAVTSLNRDLEREFYRRRIGEATRREMESPYDLDGTSLYRSEQGTPDETPSELDDQDLGAWFPGQGVRIDFPAIIDILLRQMEEKREDVQQSLALRWLSEFLNFAPEVIVPFTPRLVAAVLPNLASNVPIIENPAIRLNKHLFSVIQHLPIVPDRPPMSPPPPPQPPVPTRTGPGDKGTPVKSPRSPTPTASTSSQAGRQSSLSREIAKDNSSSDLPQEISNVHQRAKTAPVTGLSGISSSDPSATPRPLQESTSEPPRSDSPVPNTPDASQGATPKAEEPIDPFDYLATVTEITVQFLSDYQETRVQALKWLIMLHQKVPSKILAMHDATFPVLLKTLSDSSEDVIKYDLQLIAQISSSSEETYFKSFMTKLIELFGTDRRLLDNRGSLIIRQLCLNLSTEKIYRTFAEIIEKEEDLEFASVIVQKLNIILITSPELAEFRRRLKTVETRQDGQALFTALYRCWCHNAVSAFALCLIAQAYEHASNLLHIFADLEITVPMLVQVDKLVQLIESPVFTYLRLQLLEPERYPYLFKCLYGLLMLLPQSSAFVSLRNRLNAVNSAGFLHIAPKSATTLSNRSKLGVHEIKWQELIQHFRAVQLKHEKARRQASGIDSMSLSGFPESDKASDSGSAGDKSTKPGGRIPMRRRVTGGDLGGPVPPLPSTAAANARGPALSPLNPKSRAPGPSPSKARRPELTRK